MRIYEPQIMRGLSSSGAAISFFQHGAIAAAAKTEPVVHIPFRPDARAAGWNTALGRHPHLTRAFVDLVCPRPQSAITVRNGSCDPNLFAAITVGIGVDLRDIGLARAGCQEARCASQHDENSDFLQCKHWRLLDVVFIRESSGERWT